MLSGQNLSCQRDERLLFADINFRLSPGEALQVVGPNGCGKTSLLRIICGLLPQQSGELYWHDHLMQDCRSQFYANLLYLGHKKGVKLGLTAAENLLLQNTENNQQAVDHALGRVGLFGFEDVLCRQLSAGQKQRVALANLLLSKATLWILDEPFTAIDQSGISEFEQLLGLHVKQGGMLLLTTHHRLKLPNVLVNQLNLGCM